MSERLEVSVNYGDRSFKLVRIERLYEITDGKEKLIRQGGDYILNLAGHNAGSWETYRSSPNSFSTLEYQERFKNDNHYSIATEEVQVEEVAQELPTAESEQPEETKDRQIFPGTLVDVDLSDDEKSRGLTAVSGIWKGPNGQEYITVMDGDKAPHVPIKQVSIHEDGWPLETQTPVEETTPQGKPLPRPGLRDRLRYHLSGSSAYSALSRRVEERNGRNVIVTEEELPPGVEYIPDERGRFGAGVVAGAIAVGATALITWALTRHGGHSHELTEIINQNTNLNSKVNHLQNSVNHDTGLINQNHQILVHNRAELKQLHEQVHHLYKLEKAEASGGPAGVSGSEARLNYSGDTVWHETARRLREKLGYSASAAKIHKATAYVLRLNGWRWSGGGVGVDAHELPIGTPINMPTNIVEIANS